MTSKATLAELRRLTIQRWCPWCAAPAGSPCWKIASAPAKVPSPYFHEARYGPVREAWNARLTTTAEPIIHRRPTTATRIQGNVFMGGGRGGSGRYTFSW